MRDIKVDKDKEIEFLNQQESEEDIDWETFFTEEDPEEWEKEKGRRKKRKAIVMRTIATLLVLSLLISGLEVWSRFMNSAAIEFLEASNRLSRQPEVKTFKDSVVTIEWDGVKGTGFNIDSEGLIVTNEHVVENANKVKVHFNTGKSYVGKVTLKDPALDLAIIDIEANNLPVLPIASEQEWRKWQGERIIFIGNPLAFTQIANEGTIVGEVVLKDWDVPVMVVEAPIYKGNSGSPIINQDGEVIGVIFATLQNPSIDTKEIIGVATPAYYIDKILQKLKK
jgi:serine protease Do